MDEEGAFGEAQREVQKYVFHQIQAFSFFPFLSFFSDSSVEKVNNVIVTLKVN